MLKAISLPSRANTVKALALAYKTLADAGAPLGKKEAAAGAAETAGEGTGWGDDLGAGRPAQLMGDAALVGHRLSGLGRAPASRAAPWSRRCRCSPPSATRRCGSSTG